MVKHQRVVSSNAANSILAGGLGIFIFIFLTAYVGMIAQEIANEKSSRIMEILLAVTSAGVQFFGKLLGVAALAITHGIVYVVAGVVAMPLYLIINMLIWLRSYLLVLMLALL